MLTLTNYQPLSQPSPLGEGVIDISSFYRLFPPGGNGKEGISLIVNGALLSRISISFESSAE